MRRGLFLFSNDLRLHDNAALRRIASQVDELLLVYCLDPELFRPRFCQTPALGSHRLKFIQESLRDLQAQLASLGQRLTIVEGVGNAHDSRAGRALRRCSHRAGAGHRAG